MSKKEIRFLKDLGSAKAWVDDMITAEEAAHFETFTQRMEKELVANAHKGDWRSFAVKENRPEILREIEHHYNKLVMAFESDKEELIREHSADIGNIAMFMYESTKSK